MRSSGLKLSLTRSLKASSFLAAQLLRLTMKKGFLIGKTTRGDGDGGDKKRKTSADEKTSAGDGPCADEKTNAGTEPGTSAGSTDDRRSTAMFTATIAPGYGYTYTHVTASHERDPHYGQDPNVPHEVPQTWFAELVPTHPNFSKILVPPWGKGRSSAVLF